MENYVASMSYSQEYEDSGCEVEVDELTPCKRILNYYIKNMADENVFKAFYKVVVKIVHNISTVQKILDIFKQKSQLDKVLLMDVYNKFLICGDSDPIDNNYYEFCVDSCTNSLQLMGIYSDLFDESFSSHFCFNHHENVSEEAVVCIKGLNKYLGLVYIMRADIFRKRAIIDYNFDCARQAIDEVMALYASSTNYLDSSDFDTSVSMKLLEFSDHIYSL